MALTVKKLAERPERLASGHRACAGCTAPTLLRLALRATEDHVACGIATGCMEVVTTIYPYSAWRCALIHSAFENVAATVSGIQAAYVALKRRGKVKERFKFIAFAGDGGTYDIGIQSLSGAMERGHDMLYICYDNEAYMNTGIQRSGATPLGAATTTSQAGRVQLGKQENRKDLTAIMAAHDPPYVAQASIHNIRDLVNKIAKGLQIEGPAFLNVLAPCHRGWRIPVDEGIEYARLAVETCFWPLYEVEDRRYKVNFKPKEKRPVEAWLEGQGRFRHLFRDERGRELIDRLQGEVDRKWEELLKRAEA